MASLVFLWGEAQLRNSGWLGLPLRLSTDKKEPRSAAYPVCVVSRRGPRGEPWLQQVQVFFLMQSLFNRCCFAIYCRGDQEIILQSNFFSVHAVELKNKNKSVGTVSGWHSGSAFGSDTKGRRFKSLKIKDLLCRVDSLQAKPLCC